MRFAGPLAGRPATSTGSSRPRRPMPSRSTTACGGRCARLPPKQRVAIVHRFVLDLAYADIGERMGTSEEAARQNVSAGLRRLRREVPA